MMSDFLVGFVQGVGESIEKRKAQNEKLELRQMEIFEQSLKEYRQAQAEARAKVSKVQTLAQTYSVDPAVIAGAVSSGYEPGSDAFFQFVQQNKGVKGKLKAETQEVFSPATQEIKPQGFDAKRLFASAFGIKNPEDIREDTMRRLAASTGMSLDEVRRATEGSVADPLAPMMAGAQFTQPDMGKIKTERDVAEYIAKQEARNKNKPPSEADTARQIIDSLNPSGTAPQVQPVPGGVLTASQPKLGAPTPPNKLVESVEPPARPPGAGTPITVDPERGSLTMRAIQEYRRLNGGRTPSQNELNEFIAKTGFQ